MNLAVLCGDFFFFLLSMSVPWKKKKKNRHLTECSMPLNSRKSRKTLLVASNRLDYKLERLMSTTIRAFSSATPIDHTYKCHVLFPLCRLNLSIGKGRRVIKSISTCTY